MPLTPSPEPLTCECGQPFILIERGATLVGFMSSKGHDHDDNCLRLRYRCPNGHDLVVHPRRKCPAEGCEWQGKLTCFCHDGEKAWIWTNEHPAKR